MIVTDFTFDPKDKSAHAKYSMLEWSRRAEQAEVDAQIYADEGWHDHAALSHLEAAEAWAQAERYERLV